MYAYCREFPVKLIPHVTETGEVNDIIHHYKKPGGANRGADAAKPAQKATPKPGQSAQTTSKKKGKETAENVKQEAEAEEPGFVQRDQVPGDNLALVPGTPNLHHLDIEAALNQITSEDTAQMIGLVCHLAHWRVFGHLNPLPLDPYHLKQLFIRIAKIQQAYECKAWGERAAAFIPFIMPMVVLAVRIEVASIFKRNFSVFFSKKQHEQVALKQINDVITHLIDPNVYYSRLSFFESGRRAIHIKYAKAKRSSQEGG